MIQHYIKVALRLIERSMLFSLINMLGFVFGMAAAFLIYLWVVNELTYEDYNPDTDRIYRVVEVVRQQTGEITESSSTVLALPEIFKENFPQVEAATAIKYIGEGSMETGEGKSLSGYRVYTDTAFFQVFPFEVMAGNLTDMKKGNYIVLSEKMAIKLFGSATAAIGQKLKEVADDLYGWEAKKVVAVVKIPSKCHIYFDILCDLDNFAKAYGIDRNTFREDQHVYVKMKLGDAGKMYAKEHSEMSRVFSKLGDKNTLIRFQPIKDIHLKTNFADPNVKNHGSMASIYLFIGLAVLVIFMGAFNFMTLSTARASMRWGAQGDRRQAQDVDYTVLVRRYGAGCHLFGVGFGSDGTDASSFQ